MFLSSYSYSSKDFSIHCPVTPCALCTPTDTIHLVAANTHGAAELKTGVPCFSLAALFNKQVCTSPFPEVIPH